MSTFQKYFEKVLDTPSLEGVDFIKEFVNAGKSAEFDGTYDENELAMGLIVEVEHTTNRDIARKIAMDHLAERPDYYSFGRDQGIFDELEGYSEAELYDFQNAKSNKDHSQFQSFVNEFIDLLDKHNLIGQRVLINMFLNDLYKRNFASPPPPSKKQEVIEPKYPET